jgi:hypothetical protein
MNIFAIEHDQAGNIDWVKSATSQDNLRVVKMALESCQMLCTNLNYLYGDKVSPYRSCHLNHPSTKWARESSANFLLLVKHAQALLDEYTRRFNKIHKCQGVLDRVIELYDKSMFDKHKPTPLPLCMPDEYKSNNIVESYRKFYAQKPKIRYPKSKIPNWFDQHRGGLEYDII